MSEDEKSKTLFLNGKEVTTFELSGNETKDLAAAKRLLAEQAIDEVRRHKELPAKPAESHTGARGPN